MVHFLWKVGSAADFEELNEIRVHLFVVVGNTQHSDALAGAGVLELAVERLRWVRSITIMTSSHSSCSVERGTTVSLLSPVESMSMPG